MATKKTDPTDRMVAVLERIETALHGLEAEAKETNQRLGRLESQGKRTNRRLGNLEVRLTAWRFREWPPWSSASSVSRRPSSRRLQSSDLGTRALAPK